jgi:MinD superfamily P-loop ATPase
MSGKGGTGKTTVAASFAYLAQRPPTTRIVIADADVDAANLHLLLDFRCENQERYFGGKKAIIEPTRCVGCGLCEPVCRFFAIHMENDLAHINSLTCEGCKACVFACPHDAITMEAMQSGWLRDGSAIGIPFADGELFPGEETSGKLVTEVRKLADGKALKEAAASVLVDGAPGIGCSAIASITGARALIIVTEPSKSGWHDLERMMETAKHFNVHYSVIINKYDISEAYTQFVKENLKRRNADIIGLIPFDERVVEATRKGVPVVQIGGAASEAITRIWDTTIRPLLLE